MIIKQNQLINTFKFYKFSKKEIRFIFMKFLLKFFRSTSFKSINNSKVLSKIKMYINIITLKTFFKDNIFKEKFNKTCILSGRSRAVNGSYNVSRCMIKNLLINGNLPNFRKSTW